MVGWPTNAQLPGCAPDRDPSIQVLFLPPTSSPIRGGDPAHGSEVTLLTSRIVGMLMETLVPALPAGSLLLKSLESEGVQDQTQEKGECREADVTCYRKTTRNDQIVQTLHMCLSQCFSETSGKVGEKRKETREPATLPPPQKCTAARQLRECGF